MDIQSPNGHVHKVTRHIARIRWTLPVLLAIQFASVSLLCEKLPHLQFGFLAGATVLFLLFGMWLRPYRAFGILMAVSLLLGFMLVFLAWEGHWSPWEQLTWLVNHALTLVLGTATWLVIMILHRVLVQWARAEEELNVLRKFDIDGVLTPHEFLYQLQDIVIGMNRRGERGALLIVEAITPFPPLAEAAMNQIAVLLLSSVRGRYDLVGRQSPSRLLVALQNVTDDGLQVVIARLSNAIHELLANADDIIRIQQIELHGPWESVRQTLREHEILLEIQEATWSTPRKGIS